MDERVPEHRDSYTSSSHESSSVPQRKMASDEQQSIKTHFSKDRICEICRRTKITTAPRRRRIGGVLLRAEYFGDLITAEHKVLFEGCVSRNNHRFVVVVQDLTTQRIQSYQCKTITSQETERSLKSFWS